jgi:hypothetical protein
MGSIASCRLNQPLTLQPRYLTAFPTRSIADAVRVVREHLERLDLQGAVIIAHSKGGLIAKHNLGEPDTLARVSRVIAIDTPFSRFSYAYLFWLPSVRMFTPTGPTIRQLGLHTAGNNMITSLSSVFDRTYPSPAN